MTAFRNVCSAWTSEPDIIRSVQRQVNGNVRIKFGKGFTHSDDKRENKTIAPIVTFDLAPNFVYVQCSFNGRYPLFQICIQGMIV